MAAQYSETIRVFKAFCDENRLSILGLLRSGEKCACDLLEDLRITQPTLSHHMKILCDAGIVQGRKEGKWVYYSIDPVGAEKVKVILEQQLTVSGSNNGVNE
ncbi:ArsR/SmtB family transcription factor [Lacrimispora sp. 210928-DFI.3.58]|uniref:ArsR/SmtB family transcription factor n=1 Tax=Lacrimispora sp. 210928-DFI.3.58 TaxID=2883214 RepID=UPI001D08E43E|nr:metalloregulator ArsR/SmtB family transcription factor [Lacrimispora sp. 210928-DFI.3.58]MCB7321152.1 metalloregulator ArsR/SmtB family transcription factor [Lacrimispora sp. 210928-DFI.3.58]